MKIRGMALPSHSLLIPPGLSVAVLITMSSRIRRSPRLAKFDMARRHRKLALGCVGCGSKQKPYKIRLQRKVFEDPGTVRDEDAHEYSLQEMAWRNGIDAEKDDDSRPPPIDGDEEYLVESILAHRDAPNSMRQPEYLVKWFGYPLEENSWVREADLKCDDVLRQYFLLSTTGEMWGQLASICTDSSLSCQVP